MPKATKEDILAYLRRAEHRAMESWHERAVALVKDIQAPYRLIAEVLGVSSSSVGDAVKAVKEGRSPGMNGRPTKLTSEEESKVLLKQQEAERAGETPYPAELVRMVRPGDGPSQQEPYSLFHRQAMRIAMESRGDASGDLGLKTSPVTISPHWAHDFVKRNRDALEIGGRRKLDDLRANVSLEALKMYYIEIGLLMARHSYPSWAIANMDETSLKVSSKGRRAVVMRGMEFGFAKSDVSVGHITLAVTIFADCTTMKPLAILDVANLPDRLSERVAGAFALSGQANGWMTSHIFGEWVRCVFVPEIEKRRIIRKAPEQRVLLLVDGHSSRANPDALQYLSDHGIDAITPVSHSSHLCQPLDLRFLAVFKSHLSGMRWQLSTQPRPELRNVILEKAINGLHAASRDDVIRASWRMSGIFPFQPSVVLEGKESAGVVPLDRCPYEDRPQSKHGSSINEQVLTSPESITKLRRRKEAALIKKRGRYPISLDLEAIQPTSKRPGAPISLAMPSRFGKKKR